MNYSTFSSVWDLITKWRYVSYILNVDYVFMNVADTNRKFYETKGNKWIQDILDTVIGVVDTRPKNRSIKNSRWARVK